jgi:hypothetical protein
MAGRGESEIPVKYRRIFGAEGVGRRVGGRGVCN